MDGEVNNPTVRITQDVKRDEQDETDARDGRRRWTQEMDVLDGRIGWTHEMDARDGQDRRRQHKEGKGLRRVRGKDEGTNQRVGGGEAKRRDRRGEANE